jgi:hypothetical protein
MMAYPMRRYQRNFFPLCAMAHSKIVLRRNITSAFWGGGGRGFLS